MYNSDKAKNPRSKKSKEYLRIAKNNPKNKS